MKTFVMPSLGADMDRGTVVEWLVAPGDEVKRGDIVVLVETEKGVIEVEIWEDAVIGELLVAAGTEVPVGEPICELHAPRHGEFTAAAEPPVVPEEPPPPPPAVPVSQGPAPSPAPPVPPPPVRRLARELGVPLETVAGTGPGGAVTRDDIRRAARPGRERAPVSPRARRAAARLGVDAAVLRGTGPGGAVTERDVRAAVPAETTRPATSEPEAAPGEGTRVDRAAASAAIRHAVGQVIAKSKREIPHYYLGTDIDVTPAMEWLRDRNEDRPMAERVLPAVLLLKAAALAVHDVPEVNGFWRNDGFEPSDRIHLGVAVSLRTGGLIAPAIHDADRLGLDELMAALADLVQRARAGRLRGSEMSDPTITVTSLGDRGVREVYGVIYAPQVALVGFGTPADRPWAVDGMLGVRTVVRATLSADHRVSDGHRGGLYLAAVDRLLQEPEAL